jgi:lipoprotein-anchoring transpeptidase ErfK/SrfK
VVRGLQIAVGALAVTGLAASAIITGTPPQEGGKGKAAPAIEAAAPLAPRPKPVPTVPAPTLIATLKGETAYAARLGGPPAGALPAQNPFGATTVLAVLGPAAGGMLHVELPIRPNGSTGWIPATAATLSETSYSVRVSLAADTVSVYKAGQLVLTTPAAVGKPSTPTPPGHTFLWELIRPDNPYGAYGPYIFGLGWFSDSYSVFNGGDAQIGIHGNDEPWSIGHPVSHGCVRVGNSMITKLAGTLPLGTPVTIS